MLSPIDPNLQRGNMQEVSVEGAARVSKASSTERLPPRPLLVQSSAKITTSSR